MRTEIDLTDEEVEVKTPNPLTRVLLSQIAGLYDPIGLATPVKQKGVILVRRAFQEAGKLTKESYSFQTFFVNRIREIQKAGPVTDWWWILGEVNIADLVMRGCSPELRNENCVWQKGPSE